MVLLLCYDVTDDPRRTRLYKRLHAFLTPVQKSVFEGSLPSNRLGALVQMVRNTIDPREDSVRIYALCRTCRGQTLLLGVSPTVREPGEPILV